MSLLLGPFFAIFFLTQYNENVFPPPLNVRLTQTSPRKRPPNVYAVAPFSLFSSRCLVPCPLSHTYEGKTVLFTTFLPPSMPHPSLNSACTPSYLSIILTSPFFVDFIYYSSFPAILLGVPLVSQVFQLYACGLVHTDDVDSRSSLKSARCTDHLLFFSPFASLFPFSGDLLQFLLFERRA